MLTLYLALKNHVHMYHEVHDPIIQCGLDFRFPEILENLSKAFPLPDPSVDDLCGITFNEPVIRNFDYKQQD